MTRRCCAAVLAILASASVASAQHAELMTISSSDGVFSFTIGPVEPLAPAAFLALPAGLDPALLDDPFAVVAAGATIRAIDRIGPAGTLTRTFAVEHAAPDTTFAAYVAESSGILFVGTFSPNSGPVLEPGGGFSAPTAEPGPVGEPGAAGYDAKAIARWDVVPYQSFGRRFEVGVVAFHMNGIDRVEMSVEGGPWTSLTTMRRNPRVDVYEHYAVLEADRFDHEGPIELRAIAYPMTGEPRLLDPLTLYVYPDGKPAPNARYVSPTGSDAGGDGTAGNPFATMRRAASAIQAASASGTADDGVIYLMAGDHVRGAGNHPVPVTTDRWLTIRAAPGVDRQDVAIVGSVGNGLDTRLERFEHLTIRAGLGTGGGERLGWLDDCEMVGAGQWAGGGAWLNGFDRYITDSVIRDTYTGVAQAIVQRNVHLKRIGSEAFVRPLLVVNCSVDDVEIAPGSGWHPDILQVYGAESASNVIVYGLRATNVHAQGIFIKDQPLFEDLAFVNVLIEQKGCSSCYSSQVHNAVDHLLLWNVTVLDQTFLYRTPNIANQSVRGSCFQRIKHMYTPSDADFTSNHYIESSGHIVVTPGTDVTVGDPAFNDPAGDDFTPAAGSPLLDRFEPANAPVDLSGRFRIGASSVGAYERR